MRNLYLSTARSCLYLPCISLSSSAIGHFLCGHNQLEHGDAWFKPGIEYDDERTLITIFGSVRPTQPPPPPSTCFDIRYRDGGWTKPSNMVMRGKRRNVRQS